MSARCCSASTTTSDVLHHVGVASAMAAPLRKQLLDDVQPLRKNALEGHPWRDWADAMNEAAASGQRMPGGPNRWNATKDMSWEPLRIERVCEVEYEGLLSGRFRHNARFRHWRDDKDPDDCTYAQLEAVAPAELLEMFGVTGSPAVGPSRSRAVGRVRRRSRRPGPVRLRATIGWFCVGSSVRASSIRRSRGRGRDGRALGAGHVGRGPRFFLQSPNPADRKTRGRWR